MFWCRWRYTITRRLKKLETGATKAIMIDYSSGSRAFKLLDTATQKFVVSRDVHLEKSVSLHLHVRNISELEYSQDRSGHGIGLGCLG